MRPTDVSGPRLRKLPGAILRDASITGAVFAVVIFAVSLIAWPGLPGGQIAKSWLLARVGADQGAFAWYMTHYPVGWLFWGSVASGFAITAFVYRLSKRQLVIRPQVIRGGRLLDNDD